MGLAFAALTYTIPSTLAASDTVWDTNSQTLTCELEATHHHSYANTTGPDDDVWYYSRVTKFRIYLHDDFMENIEMDSLLCSSGGSWISCDGGTSSSDGGTRVTLNEGDTSSSAVYENYIEWEYGRSDSEDSPWMAGYNDYDGDGDIDTEDEIYRNVGEYLTYDFKEDVESGSSASTTSSVWIKFWTYDIEDETWTALREDGSTDYHWNNDTDLDITYYECDSVTCESLSISPETGDLDMSDVLTDVNFTVTATGSDGSDITGDSEFTYSVNQYGSANDASDANGNIRYGWRSTSKNPSTSDSTVTFQDTEPGDTLYVYVSDYEGDSYESTCYAEVELPYCTDLTITDPGATVFGRPLSNAYIGSFSDDEYETNIDINTDTSSGESWPFDVTYESTDSTATFDGNLSPYTTTDTATDIASYVSTDSATVDVGIDPAYDVTGTCNDTFYYTLVPTIPACDTLEITTPTAPITETAMEAGNVQISWTSTLTDGTPNPSTYVCTSSNPTGQFRDSAGMIGTGMISTQMTTVYYTGEPGDTVTCMSTTPYSGGACIDTITSEADTTGPVCSDLSLDDPYVSADGGVTNVTIDLTSQSSLETLYADDTVCFDFDVSTESGFSGNLQASGYTDSSRSAFTSGLLSLSVDSGSSNVGNPATVAISGATTYSGTLCWENYDENYVLDLEVVGSESVCADTVTLPPLEDTPPEGDDDNGGNDGNGGNGSGDDDELSCDEVVEVTETDDSNICEEYTMEVCVENEDIEIVSSGDEICYYPLDHSDSTDLIDCSDDSLTIPGDSYTCYDVEIEGNVCNGDITVEYNGDACETYSPEQAEVGVLNKFIYTFNFIDEKVYNSDEEVFFTHDEDRTFYTLDYEPSGAESTLVFTDDMWSTTGIEGVFGSTGNDSGGEVRLPENRSELLSSATYSTIKAFGFGDEYEEGSSTYLEPYVLGFDTSAAYQTFVPYLKYEDSDANPSTVIYACAPATDEDGDTVYGEDGLLCFNPEYTPEDDGQVVILNADAIPSDATLRIRYVGVIDSGIVDECDDSDDECLTEIFQNSAQVFADPTDIDAVESFEDSDDCTEDVACSEDSSTLVVLCSYLMTQNAGDIYLEGDLDSGSDISCAYINDEQNYSSYSNTDGLVIVDADDDDDSTSSSSSSSSSSTSTTATYYDSSISDISICDSDNTTDNLIGNISSYVCEIVSAVSDLWKGSTVSSTTDSNVEQSIRNAETAHEAGTSETYTSFAAMQTALENSNNPDSGILYFEGDAAGSTITLDGTNGLFEVPCGAWTLIVTDADLIIESDIQYATSCTNGKNYTTDLPSIAFIVEDGDIYIEEAAHELVGVYYTDQSIDGADRSAVDGDLTIDGSIYGNIDPLLDAANYVGSPSLDGGSVVVRYDSRILLNTPPGLSEYVDVDTQKGVN